MVKNGEEDRLVVRVGKDVHRKLREISDTFHVNISGVVKDFLNSWISEFESNVETAFMKAWRDDNVFKNRVVDEITGNLESKVDAWIAGKMKNYRTVP